MHRFVLSSVIALCAGGSLYACSEDAAAPGSDAGVEAGGDGADDASGDAGDGAIPCVAFTMPAECARDGGADGGDAADVPLDLKCTGLYGDFEARALACDVHEFAPGFALWSDGAQKRRFIALPAGKTIDATDMDDWRFPIGTRVWKEFAIALPDGGTTVVETRLFAKLPHPISVNGVWKWTTYVWSQDGKTATRLDDGAKGVRGTRYEIPTQKQCGECHDGRQDKVLGFDAILMSAPEAKGLTYAELTRLGLLTAPGALPDPSKLQIPGNAAERSALGYLHANCGVACHNETTANPANQSGLHMKLTADKLRSPASTDTVVTGANKTPGNNWPGQPAPPAGGWFAIHPGDLTRSMLPARMRARDVEIDGGRAQMPPLISHAVDDAGVAAVSAWIASMTVDAGYPAPAP